MPPTTQDKCDDPRGDLSDAVPMCKCAVSSSTVIVADDGDPEEDPNDWAGSEEVLRNPSDKISVKLTVLNLSGQGLASFPETEDLPNLNVLNLSKNEISELPSTLKSARFLRVLNVSRNGLTAFPQVLLDGLYILKEVNLSYNAINTLPRPNCYQHLMVLGARNCNIYKFPLWILYELHFLEILDLSLNDIFGNMAPAQNRPFHQSCNNLKRVNFSNTCFSDPHVPIVSQFSQLEYLDVGNYTLRFSNSFVGFNDHLPRNLKVLKARNCRMFEKVNLSNTSTEKTNLSCNTLVALNAVDISIHMRFLVLNECYLVSLPENFGDMSHLVYLNLSRNDLGYLPASFGNLKELVHLDLYENTFMEFPSKELLPLKKITCFDMCRNQFEVPSYPLGEEAPSYEILRASLRSAITLLRENGKIPVLEPEYDDADFRTGSRYSDDDEDNEYDATNSEATDRSSSPPRTPVVNNVEDEDWDAVDPHTIYCDPLPRVNYRSTVDPFANDYTEEWLQKALRNVPVRVRDSPFFFYRPAKPSVLLQPPSPYSSQEPEPIVQGQFDDA